MTRFLCSARSACGLVFGVLFTGAMSVLTLAAVALGRDLLIDRFVVFWGRTCLRVFNVRVRLHDAQNIPGDRGALFLFNHQSLFDVPCMYGFVPKRLRFGAKAELFKIPFFGAAMRAIGTLPIERDNRGEVFKIYREVEAKFAMNWSVALAPEGTRQSKPEIGAFKKGPFIFAVNAQAPIVPVVLSGAYEVLPRGRLLPNADRWASTVHVRFLPLIETKGLATGDVAQLTQTAHEKVLAAFADLRRLPL